MKNYLARNFILLDDLDSYKDILKKKIIASGKSFDLKEIDILFNKIKTIRNNEKDYARMCNDLKIFKEEFVLENIDLFNELLSITKEERQVLLIECGYLNDYSDDYKIFELINKMVNDYNKIIENEINNNFDIKPFDKNGALSIAEELKKYKNKQFIFKINEEFLSLYPAITRYPILMKTFIQLSKNVGNIAKEKALKVFNDKRYQYRKSIDSYVEIRKTKELRKKFNSKK